MKRIAFLSVLLVCGSVVFAQDVITKTDGTEIQVKVTGVSQTQVSYKLYSDLEGPTYNLSTSKIRTIAYETGGRQVFDTQAVTAQKKSQPQGVMVYDKKKGRATVNGVALTNDNLSRYFSGDDLKLYKNGSSMYTAGSILSYIGAFPIGYCIGYSLGSGGKGDSGINGKVLLGGGVILASGIIIGSIGQKKMKEAVNHYNGNTLAFQPQLSLFSATGYDISLGLTLTF